MNRITATFKTPDILDDLLDSLFPKPNLEDGELDEEQEEVRLEAREEAKAKLEKFIEYRENIFVEFDLEAGTATVLEVRRCV